MPKARAPSYRAATIFPPTRPTFAPASLRRRPARRPAARRFSCSPWARPTRSIAPSMWRRCRHGWRCGRSTAKPDGSMRSSAASRRRRSGLAAASDHGAVRDAGCGAARLADFRGADSRPRSAPGSAEGQGRHSRRPVCRRLRVQQRLPCELPLRPFPAPRRLALQVPALQAQALQVQMLPSRASRRLRCRRRSKSGRRQVLRQSGAAAAEAAAAAGADAAAMTGAFNLSRGLQGLSQAA